jgi:hypothetical protein
MERYLETYLQLVEKNLNPAKKETMQAEIDGLLHQILFFLVLFGHILCKHA